MEVAVSSSIIKYGVGTRLAIFCEADSATKIPLLFDLSEEISSNRALKDAALRSSAPIKIEVISSSSLLAGDIGVFAGTVYVVRGVTSLGSLSMSTLSSLTAQTFMKDIAIKVKNFCKNSFKSPLMQNKKT
jgi:hypothetical protein